MALRVRKNGDILCAALSKPLEGDTYIDDNLHYQMSVVYGVIVSLPEPQHSNNPLWWWSGNAPNGVDNIFVKGDEK